MTMTYVDEAVGITAAATAVGTPVAVSFTAETDGALPDGTPLADAIRATDEATNGGPVYYGAQSPGSQIFIGARVRRYSVQSAEAGVRRNNERGEGTSVARWWTLGSPAPLACCAW